MATTSGGGFRAYTIQDLLGSIINQQNQNSLTGSTTAQQSVLNALVGWGDMITPTDTMTDAHGNATAYSNFTFNGGVYT